MAVIYGNTIYLGGNNQVIVMLYVMALGKIRYIITWALICY